MSDVMVMARPTARRGTKPEPPPRLVELTPEQWVNVPDNPRQRDTERHLARSPHLYRPIPMHADVAAAVLPDGRWVKLDGHTRALLWSREPGLAPPTVYVRLYQVESLAEAAEYYPTFDSREAMETNSDKASGALRAAGISPSQPFLRRGTFFQGLEWADALLAGSESAATRKGGPSVYELVMKWRPEIEAFDALPTVAAARMNAPLFAGALLTLARWPDRATEFWGLYAGDRGTKIENTMDGVEAVGWLVARMRRKSSMERFTYVSRVVSAFEFWRRGRKYSMAAGTGPKTTDLATYLAPLQPRP